MSEVQKEKKNVMPRLMKTINMKSNGKKKPKDFVFCLFKKVSYFGFALFKNSKTKADSTAIGM